MKVIDLTHTVEEGMPVYPGMSQPKLEKAFEVKIHGYAETMLNMLSHTGTHMDAPAHMIEGGKSLDQYSVDSFIGKGIIVDVRDKAEITQDLLKPVELRISEVEFVLFLTGWSNLWGEKRYFTGFPALSGQAANWIANSGIKGIGLDCISADKAESTEYLVHHILFKKDLLIIENLANLESLIGRDFMFGCLPLKFKDADGAPVRAVGWY